MKEGDVDDASSGTEAGNIVVFGETRNAVDEGDTGNAVVDGDTGSAASDGDAGNESLPRSSESGASGKRKRSTSGDAGSAIFSGEQGAKFALAGDAGKLVQGLVSAVSREAAYEKLESVGDGYPESRSS